MISAYESGARQPSLPALRRLVAATGLELALDIHPVRPHRPRRATLRAVRQRRAAVIDRARQIGASNVRVFGSVARGEDTDASDIDLLVDLAPGTGLLALAQLRRELTGLLGRPVDVVPADSVKPRYQDEILREAVPL